MAVTLIFSLLYNNEIMQLTTQALILAVILGTLLIVSNIILVAHKAFGPDAMLSALIGAAVIALMVYDTDCLTRGQCHGWSWIRTALYSIVPVIAIIHSLWNLKKDKEQKHIV